MTIRERIENSPVFFLLASLFAGFGAGLGAYKGIIAIADLRVVPAASICGAEVLQGLRDRVKQMESDNSVLKAQVAAPRHWLYVNGVDFTNKGAQVRLIAEIDNTTYSFPTSLTWADGDAFPSDSLPLASDVSTHQVRFTTRYTLPHLPWQQAGSTELVTTPSIPYSGEYKLYDGGPANPAGAAVARVRYAIRPPGLVVP